MEFSSTENMSLSRLGYYKLVASILGFLVTFLTFLDYLLWGEPDGMVPEQPTW